MEESYSKIGFIFGGDAIFELRVFLNDGLIFYKQRYLDSMLDKRVATIVTAYRVQSFFFALKIVEKIIHN